MSDARRDDAPGQQRDALLRGYGVLDGTTPNRDLQALVDMTAQICAVPNAAINLITSTQQRQVAATGFEPAICLREDSMCAIVLERPDPVVVPDATEDDRFRLNPFVTGSLGDVRFYASAPLTTPKGGIIGRLCVFDTAPRRLTAEQQQALTVLADRIVDVLELRLRSRQLEESLSDLTAAQDELRRSNELLSVFAGQVSHDLRSPCRPSWPARRCSGSARRWPRTPSRSASSAPPCGPPRGWRASSRSS
jgi:GAF domain-containing protein